MLTSVDGVVERPDQFVFEFDEAMEANLGDVIGAQDTVLLGRKMYDEWSRSWPKFGDQPFADFISNGSTEASHRPGRCSRRNWSTSCGWSSRRAWSGAVGACSSMSDPTRSSSSSASAAGPGRCWSTTRSNKVNGD